MIGKVNWRVSKTADHHTGKTGSGETITGLGNDPALLPPVAEPPEFREETDHLYRTLAGMPDTTRVRAPRSLGNH